MRVFAVHAELRHRRSQPFSISPNSGGKKCDHLVVGTRKRPSDSRGLQWPIRGTVRGFQPHGGTIEPVRAIGNTMFVIRRVTLPAASNAFDNVASTLNRSRAAGGGTSGVLSPHHTASQNHAQRTSHRHEVCRSSHSFNLPTFRSQWFQTRSRRERCSCSSSGLHLRG